MECPQRRSHRFQRLAARRGAAGLGGHRQLGLCPADHAFPAGRDERMGGGPPRRDGRLPLRLHAAGGVGAGARVSQSRPLPRRRRDRLQRQPLDQSRHPGGGPRRLAALPGLRQPPDPHLGGLVPAGDPARRQLHRPDALRQRRGRAAGAHRPRQLTGRALPHRRVRRRLGADRRRRGLAEHLPLRARHLPVDDRQVPDRERLAPHLEARRRARQPGLQRLAEHVPDLRHLRRDRRRQRLWRLQQRLVHRLCGLRAVRQRRQRQRRLRRDRRQLQDPRPALERRPSRAAERARQRHSRGRLVRHDEQPARDRLARLPGRPALRLAAPVRGPHQERQRLRRGGALGRRPVRQPHRRVPRRHRRRRLQRAGDVQRPRLRGVRIHRRPPHPPVRQGVRVRLLGDRRGQRLLVRHRGRLQRRQPRRRTLGRRTQLPERPLRHERRPRHGEHGPGDLHPLGHPQDRAPHPRTALPGLHLPRGRRHPVHPERLVARPRGPGVERPHGPDLRTRRGVHGSPQPRHRRQRRLRAGRWRGELQLRVQRYPDEGRRDLRQQQVRVLRLRGAHVGAGRRGQRRRNRAAGERAHRPATARGGAGHLLPRHPPARAHLRRAGAVERGGGHLDRDRLRRRRRCRRHARRCDHRAHDLEHHHPHAPGLEPRAHRHPGT